MVTYEKVKQEIIKDAKYCETMEVRKLETYYYYLGIIATLLDKNFITEEEHTELSSTMQEYLVDKIKDNETD